MEKIDSLGNRFSFKPREKKKKDKPDLVENQTFSNSLKSLIEKNEVNFDFEDDKGNKNILSELLDEVYEKGEQLKSSPTLQNIKEYRWSVKKLLKTITERMLKTEEKVSGANILKRKRFTLIKVIDKKMESLASEFLSRQSEQLKILSKVNEINGLLVDLLS